MSKNNQMDDLPEMDFEGYQIEDNDGDWGLWEADVSLGGSLTPTVSLEELVESLVVSNEFPNLVDLLALSDLSQDGAGLVSRQWAMIPNDTRRQLVEELVRLAEEDVHMHPGRVLRIAMRDELPEIRRIAIQGLWEDNDSDLVGPLTHLLRTDDAQEVRAAAAGALGSFVLAGELEELDSTLAMRVEEALLEVLRNEEEPIQVQSRALESIAYSGEAGIRELIEDAYYSPFEELRVASLNAMGRSADVRWRELVHAELENPSREMRVNAVLACGELEASAAIDDVIDLLNDEEEIVRLAAIYALGRLGGKDARDALREVADSDYEAEAAAAEDALDELLFMQSQNEMSLLDESVQDEWDDTINGSEPWDRWLRRDDDDLGSYG